MKTNRRKFFQIAGVAGAGVLSGVDIVQYQSSRHKETALASIQEAVAKQHSQQFNMCGYAAPKLETVRIGFIGLGNRGPGAVERMSNIEGVQITALCDKNPEGVKRGQMILEKHGMPSAKEYSGSEDAWKQLCESPDVDLVYICTPWSLHTPMSVYAMENGKHAATEVPAAVNGRGSMAAC
jgi:hypothetical protein